MRTVVGTWVIVLGLVGDVSPVSAGGRQGSGATVGASAPPFRAGGVAVPRVIAAPVQAAPVKGPDGLGVPTFVTMVCGPSGGCTNVKP